MLYTTGPLIVDRALQQSSTDSQLFVQNRDLCLPHLHSTPPLEYRHNVWCEKVEWFGYPKVTKYYRYGYLFWQNSRTWQTDGRSDTYAWRHRPCLYSIAQQKYLAQHRLRTHKRGVYSDTTQLNWTQLTQLNSVQPSQSCFCLWRHDLQTEATVVHAVELCWVELRWVVSL